MRAFILLCALINILSAQTAHSFSYMYHNYANLTQLMNYYASTYPNVTFLYSVGKSVQGRELWTLALAKNNPNMHVPLRPEAKYIGAMHGNEVPSKEILISLIDHMLTNQADPDVDYLLSNTRVHIMPSMNPDGYETAILGDCDGVTGRQNANNYDLNRNFPDIFENNTAPIQPETRAVMNWLEREDFVVSANFHGGTMVVNYPFDSLKNFNSSSGSVYSKTNDDDVFISMAKNYSYNHLQMRDSSAAQCGNEFTDGITNGAEWYAVAGGMQDINYWRYGCMELTMEVSCCKFPSASELSDYWLSNKKSLLEYLKQANTGIRGIVSFKDGSRAKFVTIKIDNREPFFKTNRNGEYYRVLLPGSYNLTVAINCGNAYSIVVEVPTGSRLLEFNITLNDNILSQYKLSNLNRFAVFCSKSSENLINSASERDVVGFNVIIMNFVVFVLFSNL